MYTRFPITTSPLGDVAHRLEEHLRCSFERPCVLIVEDGADPCDSARRQGFVDPEDYDCYLRMFEASADVDFAEMDTPDGSFIVLKLDEFFPRRARGFIKLDDDTRGAAKRIARNSLKAFRLLHQLEERNQLIDDFNSRLTMDFEEQIWIRELPAKLGCCNFSTPLPKVVGHILPSLRQVIAAQSLLFVGNGKQPELAVIDGDERLASDWWLQASADPAEVFTDAEHPLVVNVARTASEAAAEKRAVDSYVVVRIKYDATLVGWLIALNRGGSGASADHTAYAKTFICSENEFGTVEASLLNASAAIIATHVQNAGFFLQKKNALIGVIRALINAVEARDLYTCGHSDRVATIAMRLGKALQLDDSTCESIYLAGLLHDIGKIGVPDVVLHKSRKLTDEEYAAIKRHPNIGYSILNHIEDLRFMLPNVLFHHESYNGTGYPLGLKRDEIPIEAKVLAVADSFDAMTSNRPYRDALSFERAAEIFRAGAGSQWDPAVIDALFSIWDELSRGDLQRSGDEPQVREPQDSPVLSDADINERLRSALRHRL